MCLAYVCLPSSFSRQLFLVPHLVHGNPPHAFANGCLSLRENIISKEEARTRQLEIWIEETEQVRTQAVSTTAAAAATVAAATAAAVAAATTPTAAAAPVDEGVGPKTEDVRQPTAATLKGSATAAQVTFVVPQAYVGTICGPVNPPHLLCCFWFRWKRVRGMLCVCFYGFPLRRIAMATALQAHTTT